ncbi:MAG: twin-arginine translocase TatA/TatE family subunit [Caulobacteraceae bacterium]|nr:MAG: twin-arginine translocase TatA/TatE family subunit [Caulobacteraceae bacterium]
MGGLSWIHWVLVIGVVALLFGGRGKLSGLMGDAAKGIKAFRDGLKNEGDEPVVQDEAPTPLPSAKPRAPTRKKTDNIVN